LRPSAFGLGFREHLAAPWRAASKAVERRSDMQPEQRPEVRQALATRIYRERRAYLLRIAERNSRSRADAEEALQEAFIAFLRAYDPGRGAHPLAWLTLVLKRECWQRTRREHLDRRAGQEAELTDGEIGCALELIPDVGRSPQEAAELRDEVAEVRERLSKLKPQERRALSLLALGYSYREIAEITGWTHTKINRCIAEGRAALRASGAGE
jgi:RNA polymerase sigma factor (sigma-70 family)